MTYPVPAVSDLIRSRFVPLSVDTSDPGRQTRDLFRRYGCLWTPMQLFLSSSGKELDRNLGYLPPDPMRALLRIVLGKWALQRQHYSEARSEFAVAAALKSGFQPQGRYWEAVARFYERQKDMSVLKSGWDELIAQHPQSLWAARADAFGVEPTGRRPV